MEAGAATMPPTTPMGTTTGMEAMLTPTSLEAGAMEATVAATGVATIREDMAAKVVLREELLVVEVVKAK